MNLSNERFDPGLLYWRDYLPLIQKLAGPGFPDCVQLSKLLPPELRSAGGHRIQFIASDQLDDHAYELRIYETGQISTRGDSWHDMFNAFAWVRFPAIKTAMNARHYHAWSHQTDDGRGPVRDALTLFDECGVIVCAKQRSLLDAIAKRCWPDAFLHNHVNELADLMVCGHAMLEKFLSPYKSMTAKALLIHDDTDNSSRERNQILEKLDHAIAQGLVRQTLLTRPACLAPLPLAGIPGWWPKEQQANDAFYKDSDVFRRPPRNLKPAPVFSLKQLLAPDSLDILSQD